MSIRLSPIQKSIVEQNDGAVLILAGPGSGKTRVLTERIRRLLSMPNEHFHILALTFTNKAANEMKERLEDIESSKNRAFIATIHSFCMDVLTNRGKPVGIEQSPNIFESFHDRKQVLLGAISNDPLLGDELKTKPPTQVNKIIDSWLEMISELKNKFISPDMIDDESTSRIYDAYNKELRASNAIDFDDLLFLTYQLFMARPKIVDLYRRQYKYLFIDEAQDMNEAQYRLISALCGTEYKNIMMVGDPKQAIFVWNGASPKYLDEFKRDFNATQINMSENYRSSQAIVRAAKSLIPQYEIEGSLPIQGEIKFITGNNETEEAINIINYIQNLISTGHKDIEGNITLSNFAIIARTRYLLNSMEKELKSKQINYHKQISSQNISESTLIQDFHLIIRIVSNPQDKLHLDILKKRWNIDIEDIIITNTPELLSKLSQVIKESSHRVILEAIERMNYTDSSCDLAKALTHLKSFTPSIPHPEERALVEEDLKAWRKHWDIFLRSQTNHSLSLVSFLGQLALGSTQQTNHEGLALLTVHASKGLEFDIVILIGMTEGTFPDYRARGIALEEETRNAFVAITRAKRILVFSYPKTRIMPWGETRAQKRSHYIDKIEGYDL